MPPAAVHPARQHPLTSSQEGRGAQPPVSGGRESKKPALSDLRRPRRPRPDRGSGGAAPSSKGGWAGNQRPHAITPTPVRADLAKPNHRVSRGGSPSGGGFGGAAPNFRGGWAGNKNPYLIVPTPVRADLAKSNPMVSRGVRPLVGGLGAHLPVSTREGSASLHSTSGKTSTGPDRAQGNRPSEIPDWDGLAR